MTGLAPGTEYSCRTYLRNVLFEGRQFLIFYTNGMMPHVLGMTQAEAEAAPSPTFPIRG